MSIRSSRAGLLRFALALATALVALAALRPQAGAQGAAPAAGGAHRVYLPAVSPGPKSATTPADPADPGTPGNPGNPGDPAPARAGAYFFTSEIKTNDAAIATDAQGGLHVAFKTFVAEVEHPAAYYGYCPGAPLADCARESGWTYTSFGDRVDEVQLALSPDGKPRLVWRQRQESSTNYDYIYAACDAASCTAEGTWQGVIVFKASVGGAFDKDNAQRAFAIDPQGRPRFVYTNAWGAGKPEGVFYVHCDADCADPSLAQWFETRITPDEQYKSETMDYPSLAFTADGRPRVVGVTGLSGEQTGLHYLACDADCGDQASWSATFLGERGGGPYIGWDLALDGQGRPRVVQYQGGLSDGDPGQLYYLACDDTCDRADSWRRVAIGEPGQGVNPDLALDSLGRPRVAYGNRPASGGGLLGYAWCDGVNCAGDPNHWRRQTVETEATLNAAFQPAIPFGCNQQVWSDAIPSLSLDAAGHPRIAYDALNSAMCYYDLGPGNGTGYRAEKIWRAARVVFFDQP